VNVTTNDTEIASDKTQYSCQYGTNNNKKLFCWPAANNCTSSGTAFSITINSSSVEMKCYDSNNPNKQTEVTNGCDSAGSTVNNKTISIPSGKTVVCKVGD